MTAQPFAYDPSKAIADAQAFFANAKEQMETVFASAGDNFGKNIEENVAKVQAQVEKAGQDAFKKYGEIEAFGKDNVNAVVTSGSVVAKSAEDINKVLVSAAEANFKAGLGAAKSLAKCKTIVEVLELQTGLAQDAFKKSLADANKIQDIAVKAANKAAEPIQARAEVAMKEVAKPVAA
ncbi:MAG: phasin family protein [Magnetovibrionaceae bacterium]